MHPKNLPTPTPMSYLPRLIWFSGLNRASKINVGFDLVRAYDFGFGSGSDFKIRPFYNSVWVCMQGQHGEIERKHPPPTTTKNRFKSFCEVGYANFRPNVFAEGKRISMEILVGVGMHA